MATHFSQKKVKKKLKNIFKISIISQTNIKYSKKIEKVEKSKSWQNEKVDKNETFEENEKVEVKTKNK